MYDNIKNYILNLVNFFFHNISYEESNKL